MTAATDAYVSIRSLTKIYDGPPALDSVDLDIAKGECVTLLGPSGSGKSTLLKLLAGFEPATSGSVVFDGEDITMLSPAERECGMVFQNYALFPHLTVAANIEYGLKIRRWDKARRSARIEEMLELVGLTGYGERRPSELSGGQQQRVAIARALAYSPPLLLMDEPLGALDRSLRLELVEQIRRIHRETGTTLIYVTHDQQEALALSDRIAIMRQARIVECDTPEHLYRHPKSDFVATFFGDANLLPVESSLDGEHIRVTVGDASVMLDRTRDANEVLPDTVALRPRAFSLTDVHDRDDRALVLQGTLQDTLFLGDETELIVSLADGKSIKALVPALSTAGLTVGESVSLRVNSENVIGLGSGTSPWTRAIDTSDEGALQ